MTHLPVPPRVTVARVAVVLAVLGLVGGVLGALAGLASGTTWAAQRDVLVRVWSIDSLVLSGQTDEITTNDLSDAATVMRSDLVIDEARSTLGSSTVSRRDLVDSISAVPAPTSNFIQVTVTGPTADEADRRAQALVEAFVLVVRDQVLDSAREIADDSAAGTYTVPADIVARAQTVASLDPVQVYTTNRTEPTGLSSTTLVAAGAVAGLGLGALAVVLLAFGPARLRDPDDVLETLGLPGTAWTGPDDAGVELVDDHRRSTGVPASLLAAARDGVVAVCPARVEDDATARDFAAWLVADVPGAIALAPGDTPDHGLVILEAPAVALSSSRLPAKSVELLVLVTAAGVPADAVVRARDALEPWRQVDAVVLVG